MISTSQSNTQDASHQTTAFPLGGIGTGNVSLGARGELRDWEIFNVSAKGGVVPNTFFALRIQLPDKPPIMRVLEGPVQPPHAISHGYHPAMNAGLPRFATSNFRGEYPFAMIDFEDPALPISASLEAFTPLIPLNPEDSGIPCAVLTYTVRNHSAEPVSITLVGSLCNPVGGVQFDPFFNIAASKYGKTINERRAEGSLNGIFMSAEGIDTGDLNYGNMSLATDHQDVTIKPGWLRSGWWDFLQEFWDDLTADGLLNDLNYTEPSPDGRPDTGSVGILATLQPGEERSFRFLLTWYFPNRRHSWFNTFDKPNPKHQSQDRTTIRNHYATCFTDSWAAAQYVTQEWQRLEKGTRDFHRAMFDSTLPPYVLAAISANIVPLRSNTCFWLEDGRFYGWEGCFDNGGSCAGTCTHVWSYAYTGAYLFPSLEREMRRIEFTIETEPDGFMMFRNFKSMGEEFVWSWGAKKPEAASDGQMGCILRAFREWQLSGDREWLRSLWPGIQRAIKYANDQWDTDHDDVLDGKQHNTYDIEFYGPNPLSSLYYLAALRAVEEIAKVLDEPAIAQQYHEAFERGSTRLDKLLWNGEYFIQAIDNVDEYKYQHGLGCLADQLLGQVHAHALGLGDLLPAEHIRKAVKSIFDYNFRTDFKEHSNCQRTYVLNDEAGLLLCTWPHGGRPVFPFVYSDEVWPGVEYHVAAELIYDGWHEAGLQIIKAVDDRHDGKKRNRWDEVECGHHYARSMSSWMVLLALSGQQGDLGSATLSFNPALEASSDPDRYQCFWSNGRAWGRYSQSRASASAQWIPEVEVFGGSLDGVTITACGKSWKVSN